MDKLNEYLKTVEFDSSRNLVTEDFIKNLQIELNIPVGNQLKEYILKYGYIGYKFFELYGINSRQGMESDLIKQTRYLHQYFEDTKQYFALANEGDGEYILIDSKDEVFSFDSNAHELFDKDLKLEDFIIDSIKQLED